MFNRVELGRIRRKKQKFAASVLGSRNKPLLGMEGSIVHYNYGALFQGRQELLCKPKFKKGAVHGAAILKRSQNFISHLSGDNTATLIFPATDLTIHFLAPGSIAVFPIQVCIYAAFVHIDRLFWRYILDFFLICRYFFRILFPIPRCLFFRVILWCRSASRMPLSLHPNASAISD